MLLMLVFILCPATEIAAQNLSKAYIKGNWVSNKDAKYIINADDSVITEYYDGKVTATYNYEILSHSCDETYLKETDKMVVFLHKYNKDEDNCYEIVGADKDNLSFIYTGRGNILSFKRFNGKLK